MVGRLRGYTSAMPPRWLVTVLVVLAIIALCFVIAPHTDIVRAMGDRKYMDIAEFQRLGLLQEINRLFLHPLGLALEVTVAEDGTKMLSGVQDDRDDLEGIYFTDLSEADVARALDLFSEVDRRAPHRLAALGYIIQPLEAST